MSFLTDPGPRNVKPIALASLIWFSLFWKANAQNLIAYNGNAGGLYGTPIVQPAVVKTNPVATNENATDVECRGPRTDELAAVNKARQVIDKSIVGGLQRMGWQAQTSDQVKVSIATHTNPFRPMFICSRAFDLTISPDPNTAYGKMVNDSIRYYQTQTSSAAILRMVLLRALQNIKIRIEENEPYLKSRYDHDDNDKYTILNIPGAAYAYRLTEPEQGAGADIPPDYKTFVLIGNWAGANMNFSGYEKYPFIHKTGGAYIETLSIQIAGPASVADKIIHNIDWQGLSAGLTR